MDDRLSFPSQLYWDFCSCAHEKSKTFNMFLPLFLLNNCIQANFVLISWVALPDHDCRLQADLSKWHSNCLSHQWFSHTWGRQACKVCWYSSVLYCLHKCQKTLLTAVTILFQEASEDTGQVLYVELFLGLFPMVLQWWRWLRFQELPNIRPWSLQE